MDSDDFSQWCEWRVIASLAPLGEVPGPDNTDGVMIPGLEHLTHCHKHIFLRVILQDGVIVV